MALDDHCEVNCVSSKNILLIIEEVGKESGRIKMHGQNIKEKKFNERFITGNRYF